MLYFQWGPQRSQFTRSFCNEDKTLKKLIILICALSLIFVFPIYKLKSAPIITSDIVKKIPTVNKSVVRINNICSGGIIGNGYVVTAAHCMMGKSARVEFYDHSRKIFKVLYTGKTNTPYDFAILEGDTKGLPVLPLSSTQPHFLEPLVHYGYNHNPTQWKTPGMYLQYMCTRHGCEYYIACKVIPGDSGGLVVSRITGEVIGIAYASYWPISVGIALIVPSKFIIEKLDELKIDSSSEEQDSHTYQKI